MKNNPQPIDPTYACTMVPVTNKPLKVKQMTSLQALRLLVKRLDEILPADWTTDPTFADLRCAACRNGLSGKLLIIRRSDTQQGQEFRLEWR